MTLLREVLDSIMKSRTRDPALDLANAAMDVGMFAPQIAGTTVPGTATYEGQSGQYLRFGRFVIVQYRITTSAHTGSGQAYIPNMPFAAVSGFPSGYFSGAVYSGSQAIGFALLAPGSRALYFYGPNPGAASNVPGGNGDWLGSIAYWTD